MIQYDKFRKSLERLIEQYENFNKHDSTLPRIMQESVAESLIQRFETCYNCLWKVLKRYMNEELGITDLPNSSKPLFRIAHENKLLPSSLEYWMQYAQARINTFHDYDVEKALSCLEIIQPFIKDSIELYQVMSGESWNRI